MIPRTAYLPGIGPIAVKPLQYGNVLRFYENSEHNSQMLAEMFNITVFFDKEEPLTAEDVNNMKPGYPDLLEYVVMLASDLLQEEGEEPEQDSSSDVQEVDYENSMFSDHQSSMKKSITEEDFIFQFTHQYNYTYEEIYRLLIGEIEQIENGSERAEARSDDKTPNTNNGNQRTQRGGQGDRASQVFGR